MGGALPASKASFHLQKCTKAISPHRIGVKDPALKPLCTCELVTRSDDLTVELSATSQLTLPDSSAAFCVCNAGSST